MICWTVRQRGDARSHECSDDIPQCVDLIELGHLIKSKDSIRETHHKEVRFSMKGGAVDLGVVLHEVMPLYNAPPHIRIIIRVVIVAFVHLIILDRPWFPNIAPLE